MAVMNDNYTVTKAVNEVLNELPRGTNILGYELYSRVLHKMYEHNTGKSPLDSTVLRIVRTYGELYGVKAKSHGVSEYIKN